jgi:hypothetical protein
VIQISERFGKLIFNVLKKDITGMKKLVLYDGLTSFAGNKNRITQKLKRNSAGLVFAVKISPLQVKSFFDYVH